VTPGFSSDLADSVVILGIGSTAGYVLIIERLKLPTLVVVLLPAASFQRVNSFIFYEYQIEHFINVE